MTSIIVALTGPKRAGKDTAAAIVFPDFTRRAFADALKVEIEESHPDFKFPSGRTLSDHLEKGSWETLKECPRDGQSARSLLQDFGMSRRAWDPDYWIHPVLGGALPERLVITDTRMPNEIEAVRSQGGVLVLIRSLFLEARGIGVPRVGELSDPTSGHVTELAWREYEPDFVLVNPGHHEGLLREGNEIRSALGLPELDPSAGQSLAA